MKDKKRNRSYSYFFFDLTKAVKTDIHHNDSRPSMGIGANTEEDGGRFGGGKGEGVETGRETNHWTLRLY